MVLPCWIFCKLETLKHQTFIRNDNCSSGLAGIRYVTCFSVDSVTLSTIDSQFSTTDSANWQACFSNFENSVSFLEHSFSRRSRSALTSAATVATSWNSWVVPVENNKSSSVSFLDAILSQFAIRSLGSSSDPVIVPRVVINSFISEDQVR